MVSCGEIDGPGRTGIVDDRSKVLFVHYCCFFVLTKCGTCESTFCFLYYVFNVCCECCGVIFCVRFGSSVMVECSYLNPCYHLVSGICGLVM